MNRRDLQALSRERLRDAKLLLTKGQHIGAYYLAGYAIECALKACIARKTRRFDFPDRKPVTDSHTHDLKRLIELAGLKPQFDAASSADEVLQLNWSVIAKWNVEDRYSLDISSDEARDLYRAISAKKSGMMEWIRRHW
jgi:HEPN domain-containing protein